MDKQVFFFFYDQRDTSLYFIPTGGRKNKRSRRNDGTFTSINIRYPVFFSLSFLIFQEFHDSPSNFIPSWRKSKVYMALNFVFIPAQDELNCSKAHQMYRATYKHTEKSVCPSFFLLGQYYTFGFRERKKIQ